MRRCSIEGCEGRHMARGWCQMHYNRWWRNGDLRKRRRNHGEGTRHADGGWQFVVRGRTVFRHILMAERACGFRLGRHHPVHHVDGNRSNDANTNLVICESPAYHRLLHIRTRALKACGHANWRHCWRCGQWDAPENLRFNGHSNNVKGHRECIAAYARERRAA
jgi:hypothetical protein